MLFFDGHRNTIRDVRLALLGSIAFCLASCMDVGGELKTAAGLFSAVSHYRDDHGHWPSSADDFIRSREATKIDLKQFRHLIVTPLPNDCVTIDFATYASRGLVTLENPPRGRPSTHCAATGAH